MALGGSGSPVPNAFSEEPGEAFGYVPPGTLDDGLSLLAVWAVAAQVEMRSGNCYTFLGNPQDKVLSI